MTAAAVVVELVVWAVARLPAGEAAGVGAAAAENAGWVLQTAVSAPRGRRAVGPVHSAARELGIGGWTPRKAASSAGEAAEAVAGVRAGCSAHAVDPAAGAVAALAVPRR